jgi:hypothetical protein
VPIFFWALTRLIFEDEFYLRPVHWVLLGVIVVAGVGQSILPGIRLPWLPISLGFGFRLLSLALILHALWVVWSGRPADLVEKRARVRVAFLGAAGAGAAVAVAVAVLAGLFYGPATDRPMPARLVEALGSLAVSLCFALVIMRVDDDFLPIANRKPPALPLAGSPGSADVARDVVADRDASDLASLDSVMRNQEAWRETGLTIGGLAARIGIPEYRLRRLINQQLGHRNFATFVNEYAVTTAVHDPKEAHPSAKLVFEFADRVSATLLHVVGASSQSSW